MSICHCEERMEAIEDGKIYFQQLPRFWLIKFREGKFRCNHILEACPYCLGELPKEYDGRIQYLKVK